MPPWAAPFGLGALLATLVVGALLFRRASTLRRAAVAHSRAVVFGQAAEQLVPLTSGFPFDPSESRFLGHPVDYVVFEGLNDDGDVEVVLVEVKTGKARLSSRERRVRDAVDAGRVRFQIVRLSSA